MPAPFRPSDFCSLVPQASDAACASAKKIFFEIPDLICEFFSWMLDVNGNLSEDFIKDIGSELMPPGSIIDYASTVIPSGWLLCNGQEVSRTDYADLFAVLGTTFGSGNGTTTFNVPLLTRRFRCGVDPSNSAYAVGKDGGEETTTTVAPHQHDLLIPGAEGTQANPSQSRFLYTPGYAGGVGGGGANPDDWAQNTLHTENTTDENPTNMPPFLVLTPIIKA